MQHPIDGTKGIHEMHVHLPTISMELTGVALKCSTWHSNALALLALDWHFKTLMQLVVACDILLFVVFHIGSEMTFSFVAFENGQAS